MIIEKKVEENFDRYLSVQRKLSNIFNNNHEFIKEYSHSYSFYKQKFFTVIKEKPERSAFNDRFYKYSADLFFQGFYIAQAANTDPATVFPDQFFMQPNGLLKEQTYSIVNAYTNNELLQLVSHEETAEFETWLLDQYISLENILFQTKMDIVTYGAYQYFLEERENRNFSPQAEREDIGLISRTDDCLFLDPDKYITCIAANGKGEVWNIYHWSTHVTNRVIGEISVIYLTEKEVNESINHMPFYESAEIKKMISDQIILTANISNRVFDYEVKVMIAKLYKHIQDRYKNSLQIQIKLVRMGEILNYQPL